MWVVDDQTTIQYSYINKHIHNSMLFVILLNRIRFVQFNDLKKNVTCCFLKFWRTHVLFGGQWYPCFGFLVTSPLGFKAVLPFLLFCGVNVMHIPQDPPLVLHMPTSWWPGHSQSLPPHACAEVGLGSDSNRQSPGQKMNVLPLCLWPGLTF